MKVVSAGYVKSVVSQEHLPKGHLPEIAFAGRSNVGKSSLLNALLNRKGLAKTSRTPGKTQAINYFLVNDCFYFVDLPGYGYAKVAKSVRDAWGSFVTSYLSTRKALRLVCHLIDARHPPMRTDFELLALLDDARVSTLIVATKVDKLNATQKARLVRDLRRHLKLDEDALIVPFSAVEKTGVRDLWNVIGEVLSRKAH